MKRRFSIASLKLDAQRAAGFLLLLCGLAGPWIKSSAGAETFQIPLVDYTNEWRYFTNGTDRGTAWRESNYDDSAWPSGRGLFGEEPDPQGYMDAPFNTVFSPYRPATVTYYFRTHFTLATNPLQVVSLVFSNYIDDGAVLYLNGTEAGRFRVPVGQSFNTPATGASVEGRHDVVTNSEISEVLREGDNVLAVEVHQNGTASTDVAWGSSVTAVVSTNLPVLVAVVAQPASQTIPVGLPLLLSVGAIGTAAKFQWFKDGAPINGATGTTYAVAVTTFSSAGVYRVGVSNVLNNVSSDDAVVTISPDNSGPRLLSAVVDESSIATNTIYAVLSEECESSAGRTNNYRVTLSGTSLTVPVIGAAGNRNLIQLRVGTNNWSLGGVSNYILTVSGIKDRVGNVIAPDSQISIGWPVHLTLIDSNALWSYHAAAYFEPDIFEQGWQRPDYVEGWWWGQGYGPLCGGPAAGALCLGPYQTEIGYQPEPSLFRCSFQWPTEPAFYGATLYGSGTRIDIGGAFDDGVVIYLNGVELLRNNLPTNPIPLSAATKSVANKVNAGCTNLSVYVTNLVPGTNWLAAAVFQSTDANEADTTFALRLTATPFSRPPLPEVPVPTLTASLIATNSTRLSWLGPGYTLETITNLPPGAGNPWMEITNMSNPFTNLVTTPRRFFRLRK